VVVDDARVAEVVLVRVHVDADDGVAIVLRAFSELLSLDNGRVRV
jgi:hypothetical protein